MHKIIEKKTLVHNEKKTNKVFRLIRRDNKKKEESIQVQEYSDRYFHRYYILNGQGLYLLKHRLMLKMVQQDDNVGQCFEYSDIELIEGVIEKFAVVAVQNGEDEMEVIEIV
jgi:hypothetical protein